MTRKLGRRPGPGASAREVLRAAKRRYELAALLAAGTEDTQTELARQFGVNQSTISRDIAAMQLLWLDSIKTERLMVRRRELDRLDRLERECWRAWRRSQRRRRKREEALEFARGPVYGNRTTTETSDGDPRWLEAISRCVELRCRILGLYDAGGDRGLPAVVQAFFEDLRTQLDEEGEHRW